MKAWFLLIPILSLLENFLWEKFQIAERLAIVRPDFESFANYGAILHLNRKYDEAEIFYNKALQLQKDDETTLKNLEKLKRARAKIWKLMYLG